MKENIEIIKQILADRDESGQYNPDHLLKIIQMFIVQEAEIKKEIVLTIEDYFGHIQNDGTGKQMNLSLSEISIDLLKLVKSKNNITTNI